MAVNANTLTTKLNKLDWAACAILAMAGLGLLIAGQTSYAWLALGSAGISGVVAWLNPSQRLVRLLERKMFRKRPAR
jgi:hypothetical protein